MIGQWMKRDVVAVSPHTTVLEAARLIVDRHVGTLPVVDEQQALVGIVRVEDILGTFMPDFVRLMADFDFVRDFGVLESLMPHDKPGIAQQTMRDLMREPVAVEQTSGLLRALAVMTKHDIRDLPVVNRAGALVGIASLVDIATAFLASWTAEGSVR
jgi:CBS-domain-containing membrane protein